MMIKTMVAPISSSKHEWIAHCFGGPKDAAFRTDSVKAYQHSQVSCSIKSKSTTPGLKRRSRSRKIRPHSSPLRLEIRSKEMPSRYRSPSTSVARILGTKPAKRRPQKLNNGCVPNERIYAFGCKNGEAYFSARPPIEPMRIVVVGFPASPQRDHGMFDLMQEMSLPATGEVATSTPTPTPSLPSTRSPHSPLAHAHVYTLPDISPSASRYYPQKYHSKMSLNIVNRLLEDLVASLPDASGAVSKSLHPHPRVSDTTTTTAITRKVISAIASASGTPTREQIQSSRSRSSGGSQTRCSIAVQAPTKEISVQGIPSDSDATAGLPAEWVGGVRALRDSHVRLVLRQLRHIDRLNRALDTAAPPHLLTHHTKLQR